MNPFTLGRPARVLIIDDDPDLAFGLRMNLELEGYQVAVERDGAAAFSWRDRFNPDLVIMDLVLPTIDGLELLREWRKVDEETRIVILSARGAEADRVAGLRIGADDYVTKPFSIMELLERVKRHLRRSALLHQATQLRLGEASVDLDARIVSRNGVSYHMSDKESALLSALMNARGATLSKASLLREVWRYKTTVDTRTVEVHIATLRHKIEADPSKPRFILTVHKKGYRVPLTAPE